jgi:glucose-1-phosphate cytidylyltransferase
MSSLDSMKVLLLAGGLGTRLAEETEVRPKPLVEIGGRPILWHIMQHYGYYGCREFFVALGYRGEMIKRYFLDYHAFNSDLTIGLKTGQVDLINRYAEDWIVHLVDTGEATQTGGRVKRLRASLSDATFLLTYGDGVCNVNLRDLVRFHRERGCIATVTAVRPPARFGGLVFDHDRVARFTEKPQIGEGWINGGFLVCEPAIFDYLDDDQSSLETDALETLAEAGQLAAYQHPGFWQCMDTLRDKRLLEHLWQSGQAPWKLG